MKKERSSSTRPKNVRIAVIGPRPLTVPADDKPQTIVDKMISFWQNEFDQVLPDRPDLIVVPEACDRPLDFTMDKRLAYYRIRRNQVRDFFVTAARKNKSYLVYSAAREMDDGTWRNSSVLIDRTGKIAGIYNKNHTVIEETTKAGILCGKDAPVIECDFGKIVCAICFDLNFDEIREKYVKQSPDLIVFSSLYHGGLMQAYWAYSCRSYFVGAIAGPVSQIRNPFGEVIAASTNYRDFAVADVNLDYCLAHLDYNREKLKDLKNHYGHDVEIYDPGHVGSVLITSKSADMKAVDMAEEFNIELLDDYFKRALAHRHTPGHKET